MTPSDIKKNLTSQEIRLLKGQLLKAESALFVLPKMPLLPDLQQKIETLFNEIVELRQLVDQAQKGPSPR